MLKVYTNRWRQIIERVSLQAGWDSNALITREADDSAFVVQVRRSALGFLILRAPSSLDRFAFSCTVYSSGSLLEFSGSGFRPTDYHPAADVDDELEKWLRQSVSRYISEQGVPD
jgi:hypothetical protein